MSKKTLCDVINCDKDATSYSVDYVLYEVVPTGNSDYSATEEYTPKRGDIDLCEEHCSEYDERLKNLLIKKDGKFYFPETKSE